MSIFGNDGEKRHQVRFTGTIVTYHLDTSCFLGGIEVELPTYTRNDEVLECIGADESLNESVPVIAIVEFVELDNLINRLKLD